MTPEQEAKTSAILVAPIQASKKETREQAISRMEQQGRLDPDCASCRVVYEATDRMPYDVFNPYHKASSRCESGKRPHCACDTCF